MKPERLSSVRNPWFAASVGVTAALVIVAAAFGFMWLPSMERNTSFAGIWDAICSAAGQPQPSSPGHVVEPSYEITQVTLASRAPSLGAQGIGRGATLALRCTMCHGAQGLSQANSPNLAGQYDQVIFKQLRDYQTGARTSAVMAPLASGMTEQDAREIAAYYAYLPRPPWPNAGLPAPAIVESGAPMRGIAPCGTCHGSIAYKVGSPWLEGEPVAYLHAQLVAFKTGARHNDIEAQMRNVARAMTDEEIEAAAQYYGVPQ